MTKNRKPLIILTTLVLASAAGLSYVMRDKAGKPVEVATAPTKVEAPAPAEQPKPAEAAKPAEQQVATAQPPAATEAEPTGPAVQPPAAEPAKPEAAIPSFDTVRIEPDGAAVIAGRAEPGAQVTIKLNGAVIASGAANADGAFAIIPEKPMPAEPGVLSLEMTGKDGKMVTSEQTVAVARNAAEQTAPTVAVLKPDEPTKIIQSGGNDAGKLPAMATVNIDAVDYDEKGNMLFGGRGPAGSRVQLYMDNAPLAEAVIGADGTWTVAPTGQIAVGAHALRADEIGADGSVKSRVEIPFFREDAAKVVAMRTPAQAPATTTEQKTVAVTTPDKQTTVTATAPVTVEIKQEPAKPAETAAVEPAKPAEPAAEPAKPAEVAVAEPAKPAEAPVAAEPAKPAETAATEVAKPAETAPVAEAPAAVTETPAQPVETTEQQAAAQPAIETPEAAPVPDAKIVIQPGNNLWKLSRKIYGKGIMYTVIYEANRDYIRNPNLIYPGQIFVTPRGPDTASGQ